MLLHQAGGGGGGCRPAGIARPACDAAAAWSSTHSMHGSTKCQPPMFLGSSWHQTSSAFGKRPAPAPAPSSGRDRAARGAGYRCRRRRASRAPPAGRNRPCREHSTTRRISSSGTSLMVVAGHDCAWSRSTRWKDVPGPMSSSSETALLWRSSDLGRHQDQRLAECRAASDGAGCGNSWPASCSSQTCILSSAHSCR